MKGLGVLSLTARATAFFKAPKAPVSEAAAHTGEYKLTPPVTPVKRVRRKPRRRFGVARGPDSITLYDGCVSMWLQLGRLGPRPPRENTYQWLKKQQEALQKEVAK